LEGATKPANAGHFARHSVSEIPGFKPKFPIWPESLSRFPGKFPFCGVKKVETGSIINRMVGSPIPRSGMPTFALLSKGGSLTIDIRTRFRRLIMPTLQQTIAEKFLAALAEKEVLDTGKIEVLHDLLKSDKKLKPDDFVKVFTGEDGDLP
jgi:hypothetical protein